MPKRAGITLIELLIAIAIFSIILGAIYLLFIRGTKTYKELSKITPSYRKASLAINSISKEIKEKFYKLYAPDPEDLFAEYGKSYIVGAFEDPATEKKEVIGYFFDLNYNKLLRVIYEPSFDPLDEETQVLLETKILADNISYFYFRIEEDLLLSIGAVVDEGKREISSKIGFDF